MLPRPSRRARSDNQKTFRPKKKHVVGTKRYELHKYAQTLGAGTRLDRRAAYSSRARALRPLIGARAARALAPP